MVILHFDGLMQKRRNFIALAMELHLFYIKPPTSYTQCLYYRDNFFSCV